MISVYDQKEECCGCTACEHICPTNAITMAPDDEGFVYPEIHQELCIDCGKCRTVCAFQNGFNKSSNLETPDAYGVKHINDDVRSNSSSGGAFTGISDYILSEKGVVCGVGFNEKMEVIHNFATTKDERNFLRGSKYVQSELKDIFPEIKRMLLDSQKVLFSGTPCQVAGLRNYLELSKCSTQSLLTIDIICHGTPSPMLWKEYLNFLEKKKGKKVSGYNFRSKIKGWHEHTEVVKYDDNKSDYKSREVQIFRNIFYSHNALRPSCHNCKYTSNIRPSDITIADFRGIEKVNKDFDDNKGISLVLINTDTGRKVFDNIKGQFDCYTSNTRDCLQRNLVKPTPISKNREKFWCDYHNYGFEYIAKRYAGYNLKSTVKKNIKVILKTMGLTKVF